MRQGLIEEDEDDDNDESFSTRKDMKEKLKTSNDDIEECDGGNTERI